MTSDTETGIQRCVVALGYHEDRDEYEFCGDPVMVIDGELKHVEDRICGVCGFIDVLCDESDHQFQVQVVERGHVPEVR